MRGDGWGVGEVDVGEDGAGDLGDRLDGDVVAVGVGLRRDLAEGEADIGWLEGVGAFLVDPAHEGADWFREDLEVGEVGGFLVDYAAEVFGLEVVEFFEGDDYVAFAEFGGELWCGVRLVW